MTARTHGALCAMILVTSACSSPSSVPPVVATLRVQPVGVFHVAYSSPCHLVFPDAAFLQWETAITVTGGLGGYFTVETTIRDESMNRVLRAGAKTASQRLAAGATVVVQDHAYFGACVPEDYTKRRFSITEMVEFTDDRGRAHAIVSGPVFTGPAVP